jgi:hypothetical protein
VPVRIPALKQQVNLFLSALNEGRNWRENLPNSVIVHRNLSTQVVAHNVDNVLSAVNLIVFYLVLNIRKIFKPV